MVERVAQPLLVLEPVGLVVLGPVQLFSQVAVVLQVLVVALIPAMVVPVELRQRVGAVAAAVPLRTPFPGGLVVLAALAVVAVAVALVPRTAPVGLPVMEVVLAAMVTTGLVLAEPVMVAPCS